MNNNENAKGLPPSKTPSREQVGQNTLVSISGPVELFPTGQCMAFHNGEQVGELQKSFMNMVAENAIANGFDPEGVEIKTPRGKARIIKTEVGWKGIQC